MAYKRLAAVAVSAILLPLTLSGCIRTNADLRIGSDGDIGQAVVQVGITKSVAAKAGINNLDEFTQYINTQKRVLPGDQCTFDENANEYTINCTTVNVVDNEGAFTGITAANNNDKLIVTARKGALTEDLAEYDPSGQAVGSIMLYFDGDIQSVSAPNSAYRLPSSDVITFDLKNGRFFNDDAAVIVVEPHGDNTNIYLIVAGLFAVLGLVLVIFSRKSKSSNPFVDSDTDMAPPTKPNVGAGGLVSGAEQKARIAEKAPEESQDGTTEDSK